MGLIIKDNKFVITTELQTIHFYLLKDVNNNLTHEINFIIRRNEFLAEHKIKREIRHVLSKYKDANDTHDHGKQ